MSKQLHFHWWCQALIKSTCVGIQSMPNLCQNLCQKSMSNLPKVCGSYGKSMPNYMSKLNLCCQLYVKSCSQPMSKHLLAHCWCQVLITSTCVGIQSMPNLCQNLCQKSMSNLPKLCGSYGKSMPNYMSKHTLCCQLYVKAVAKLCQNSCFFMVDVKYWWNLLVLVSSLCQIYAKIYVRSQCQIYQNCVEAMAKLGQNICQRKICVVSSV